MGITRHDLRAASAGTNLISTGTVILSNSNNVTFGMNTNGVVTASASVAAGAGDGYNILAAGTQTAGTAATVLFNNLNGITFGMANSSVITASHNALTTAAASDHSHGNPTLALTNLSGTTASNSAGLTLSLSAGAGGAGDGFNIIAAGTQTANTTGTVVFSNSNNVSFGMTNNSIVTASASYSQSTAPGAIAAGTQTGTSGTMLFADSNGITFGMSGSTRITASHNALTSQSNQAVSFTSGSVAFQTLSFTNSNGISFNSGTQGIFASHNALTTAALSDHSHGNPTLALTNLSGTTASASNGLTLSLSAAAPGGGSPITQKMAGTPYQSVGVHGNAFLSIQPIYIDGYMTATHVKFFGSLSGNTNSSGAISMSFGLYTANGSTMSLASSQSGIIQWTSGTDSTATSATQFGIFNSARMRGLTLSSWGISPGNYMALMWLRTTNNGTLSVGFNVAQTALSLVQVQFTSEYANMHLPRVYTVSATTAMPSSIGFNDTAYNLSGSGNKQIAFSIHHSVP